MNEKEEYPDTPEGWSQRWTKEISSAKKQVEKFWEKGDKVVDAFRAEDEKEDEFFPSSRIALFHSNITTLRSMLYGRVPRVSVDRRYADANDDAARVAGEILERILNCDIEESGEDYSAVLRNVLDDRLMPGLGTARVVYEFEKGDDQDTPAQYDPAGNQTQAAVSIPTIKEEWVDTVYVFWKDVLWSPARFWSELRWRAYRTYLTREELDKKFPDVPNIPLNAKSPLDNKADSETWSKAEVWEIWDKETKSLFWYTEGFDKILGRKEDPLKLEQFFPEPPPFVANCTTGRMVPVADYIIAQDLYLEINDLQERIALLTEAIQVVGVYDKKNSELQQMFTPGTAKNRMIPVDNWAVLGEKGGLKGSVDFFPLDVIVAALDKLMAIQAAKIEQLYQVTGMSDILRGAAQAGATATEQSLKAKFASVRVQAIQDEFARFATDLQKLKAEIMIKHFQPQSFISYSNIQSTVDMESAPQAIQLLKNSDLVKWKINIQPETLAMVDYSQLRQERTEYINALGMFLQSSGPIAEKFPEAAPVLLELLKWGLAGFKGSSEIEGVIDRALAAITQKMGQPPPSPPPDPKVQIMQQEAQNNQESHQQKMEQQQAKFQQDMAKSANDAQQANQQQTREIGAMLTQFGLELQKIKAQLDADTTRHHHSTKQSVVDAALEAITSQHENDLRVQSANTDNGAGA